MISGNCRFLSSNWLELKTILYRKTQHNYIDYQGDITAEYKSCQNLFVVIKSWNTCKFDNYILSTALNQGTIESTETETETRQFFFRCL